MLQLVDLGSGRGLDDLVAAQAAAEGVTGLLRGKLGYRGVIVSDDLDMRAIADSSM